MVVQLGLKSPALKGELRGACVVTPNLETGSLRLADMNLGYKGDAPSASSIDASVKGELAFSTATGALEAKGLALRVSANTGALKLADTRLDIGRFAHDPANKRFAIGQLNLRLNGTQGGRPLQLTLEWPDLDVNGEQLKGSGISGQLTLGGDMPLDARLQSGAPGGSFDNLRVPGFEARLSSRAGTRKADGHVRSDLAVQLGKQTLALERLSVDLKLDDPALKPLSLTLQGQANMSAQSARWNVAGQVNANGFTTDGTANLTQTIPAIKTTVRFEALDLNTGGGAGAAAPDAQIDLAALRSVNGSFALRAGSIAARQFRIADALLDATLETGVLRISALQGKVWGGAVEATGLADARASRVAIKANANGVNIQALLKDVAAKDFLEGKGRVTADLDTAGRSVAELKSRLKGQLGVQLRDGAVKGLNLAKSLRQAKALVARSDASQRSSQTEKTDFSEMNVSFLVDSGVARSHDLDLKSPFLRLGGEGSVDIVKSRIDYTARATVTDTSKGQDGADLSALKGATIPVKLSGPFDALDWNIQWSAIAAGAVKSQLESRIKDKLGLPAGSASAPAAKEALKEKAQDKVKDKLKDLFKK
jgi:AsmA protein